MLRSVSKQSGEFMQSDMKMKNRCYGRKDLQKRKVLSLEWKSEEVMEY